MNDLIAKLDKIKWYWKVLISILLSFIPMIGIPMVILFWIFYGGFKMSQKQGLSGVNANSSVQTRVIQYFLQKTVISGTANYYGNAKEDVAYDELVKNQISIDEVKTRAFEKLGLDKSELTEIEPIHFEDYYFGYDDDIEQFVTLIVSGRGTSIFESVEQKWKKANIMMGVGRDGKFRSSAYQVTWLFSTQKQVCIYQEIFYLHKNETEENIKKFLWKHVTSINSQRKSLKIGQKQEKIDTLCLNVMGGESFECSMTPTNATNRAINAITQKLSES